MAQYLPVPNGEARPDFMRNARELVFYFRNPDYTYTNLGKYVDSGATPYFLPQDDPDFNLIGEVQDEDKNNQNWLRYYKFDNGSVSRSNVNLYYSKPVSTNNINAYNRTNNRTNSGPIMLDYIHIPVPNGEAREEFMNIAMRERRHLIFYFRNPDNTYTILGNYKDITGTNECIFTNGTVSCSDSNLYYSVRPPLPEGPNPYDYSGYIRNKNGGKKRKSKRSKSRRRNSRRMRSQRRK